MGRDYPPQARTPIEIPSATKSNTVNDIKVD
jgi:hypothetical protein